MPPHPDTAVRSETALETGRSATIRLWVEAADTAIALGSGDVPVLGTPRVVALCEEASVAALNGCLGGPTTSVAMRVQLDHLAPVAVGGWRVVAEAVLDKVEGRRLTFTVCVRDDHSLVAAGKVTRVLVDRVAFLDKAR